MEEFQHGAQELFNDLKAAIEVNLGEGWQILYPEKGLKFEISDLLVEVRLRDDPGICGKQVLGPQAMISQAFEDFSGRVARFLENEEGSVERERGRRQELEKLYLKQIYWKNNWLLLKGNGTMVGFCLSCFLVIGLHAADVLVSLGSVGVAVIATAIAVLASLALWYAFSYMVAVIMWDQTWRDIKHGGHDGSKILLSRALLAPFLCQFYWRTSGKFFLALASMVPCVMAALMVSEILAESDYIWTIVLLWSIPCCFCICFVYARCACQEPLSTKGYLSEIRERTAHNTLTFKGNVIPDRSKACVCSWPGKYESAWQTLVDRSHDGQISAAVVFLPKGSPNFGRHDPIPSSEALWGDCWCFPLYGEQKPWGCRWWTLWAANIEKAVRCGVELQVFFFENMKGQGKVQSFATAGAEHCQRERIWQKKEEFKESVAYREAVAAGLDSLRKDAGEDSSSQHSRELQRLFWAWLPEEDRDFLAASEGLGNSQKAEVAWLERKGYPYTQVDIIEFYRSSKGVQDVPEDHRLRALGLAW